MTAEDFCKFVWNDSIDGVLFDIQKNEYKSFEIPKKNGVRVIRYLDSNTELYKLQQKLQQKFLSRITMPPSVKGFKKGENI